VQSYAPRYVCNEKVFAARLHVLGEVVALFGRGVAMVCFSLFSVYFSFSGIVTKGAWQKIG